MEDEKIIDLYWKRDEEAITETAGKYGKLIRRIAFNILQNESDCEESESDTYRIAWEKIPPARPSYLAAFVGRIARNVSLDKYDYNHAAKRNAEFDIQLAELEDCLASSQSVEREWEQKQLAAHISSYLRELSFSKRTVFIRRYWYCDSIAQIAGQYGYSISKVKSMLLRIRKDLKIYLKEQGVGV